MTFLKSLLSIILSLQTAVIGPSKIVGPTNIPATSGGGGGVTIVQHRSTFCSAATCSLAFSSNNATGNLLIYFCGTSDSLLPNAATDSNTNTIANFALAGRNGTGNGGQRVDYVASSHSGANTVTCNAPADPRTYIAIYEISGLTNATDASNTGTQTGTNQSISTTGSTTAANEIVFGFFFDAPNNDSMTVGAGFTSGNSEFINSGSGNESMLVEAKIVSSTGTQTATMTSGSNTNGIGQSISTFK